ncbi:MAG: YjfB family protein [Spirochaetaceae bacterium]
MTDHIAATATDMSRLQTANQVQTSVLDKALGVSEEQGAAMAEMLQSEEARSDQTIVSDEALGNRIDTYA